MNYTEITKMALSYADRSDTEVTSRIDDFLRVVEARINRRIKTQRMAARTVTIAIAGQEYYALPEDFAGMRDIEVRKTLNATKRTTLSFLTPEQLNQIVNAEYSGNYVYYTIVANQLQIFPHQDGIIEMIYYKRLPALSSADNTNWLSEYNPDTYVFGLLVEISAFVKDPEAAKLWDKRFQDSLDELVYDDFMSRWSGPSLVVRAENG
jgi:hypothetical protein